MSKRQNRMNGKPRLVPSDIPESPCASPACSAPMAAPPPLPTEITTVSEAAIVGQCVEIADEEKGRVMSLGAQLDRERAEIDAKVGLLEAQKMQLSMLRCGLVNRSLALVSEIGRAHGIDSNDMTRRWNFDPNTMLFTRTL